MCVNPFRLKYSYSGRKNNSGVYLCFHVYFGMKLGDQDKSWASHKVCKTCAEHLPKRKSRRRYSLTFGLPMIWREPQNH